MTIFVPGWRNWAVFFNLKHPEPENGLTAKAVSRAADKAVVHVRTCNRSLDDMARDLHKIVVKCRIIVAHCCKFCVTLVNVDLKMRMIK